MTRPHCPAPELESEDVDKRHPGKFRAVWWPGVLHSGLVLGTVYCYDGKDAAAQAKNADLLEMVARELGCCRAPFVLGGDWNTSPKELAATGFTKRLRAGIVHTDAPTYFSGEAATELDYFVASETVLPAIAKVQAIDGSPIAKHQPIRLVFTWRARADTV